MGVQLEKIAEIGVRAQVLPVDYILEVVMQLLPPLSDVLLRREAEEGLPRQAWELRVLGPQVSVETLELAIALGELPFARSKVDDDLVEDHGLALGHALFKGG